MRLKFYRDSALDSEAVMTHVLSSETGMPVSRLLDITEGDKGQLFAKLRWKGLTPADDTLEPLANVFEDAPRLVHKFLKRRSTPQALVEKVSSTLGL